MIPILSAEQIRSSDQYTITHEPISSVDLMERAGTRCFEFISKHFSASYRFVIICGQGNNGGDGLVIARLLHQNGYNVQVIVIALRPSGTPDFEINFKKVQQLNIPYILLDKTPDYSIFGDCDIIVDAIFGTGLHKPAEGLYAKVIEMMNTSGKYIISIDIPSGLFVDGDNGHANASNTVRANETLTFECPKLAFLLQDSGSFAGDFHIIDIGLDKKFIYSLPVYSYFITASDIIPYLRPRPKFSHKGTYGHVLIIAGSASKTGAAILAGYGSLCAGAGLTTIHCPSLSTISVHSFIPEAMISTDACPEYITTLPDLDPFDVIAIGPGIGTRPETSNMLKQLITTSTKPLILDADALNILAANKTWISFLPHHSILTPHPREFDRMFGQSASAYDRLQKQIEQSVKLSIYIILKNAHTSITTPDGKVFFNSTGTPAMAKGGSGDVLTGIVAAMLAQLKSPAGACISSVYLHGLSAELAESEIGTPSLLARHIAQYFGKAVQYIQNQAYDVANT